MPRSFAIVCVAAFLGLTLLGLALGWSLGRPAVSSTTDSSLSNPAPPLVSSIPSTGDAAPLAPTLHGTARRFASETPPRFSDVARSLGIEFSYMRGETGDYWLPETMGGGVGWIDFDGDGRPDLYF